MPIIALNASQLPSLFVNHGHLVSRLNDRQNYPNPFLMYNKTPARLGTGVFCSLKRRGEITSYRPCQLLGLRRQRQRCYLLVQACQPQLLLLSATVLQLRQRFAMRSG